MPRQAENAKIRHKQAFWVTLFVSLFKKYKVAASGLTEVASDVKRSLNAHVVTTTEYASYLINEFANRRWSRALKIKAGDVGVGLILITNPHLVTVEIRKA